MRKPNSIPRTQIYLENTYEAEGLEQKLRKITETKEPIEAVWPEYYTNKKDGVDPATDIRTDRFEVAREAMEKVTQYGKRAEVQESVKTNGPETGVETVEQEPS